MTSLDAARALHARGEAVIPVLPRSKKPALQDWQNLRLADADLPRYFRNGENVGILNGEPSRWRVDVDLDSDEALGLADAILPRTAATFGRLSSPRSHRLFRSVGSRTLKFCDPRAPKECEHKTLLELRASGQTVAPGSTHPSGEAVEWTRGEDGDPAEIEPEKLAEAAGKLAAAALLVRYFPAKGTGHEGLLALAGGLLAAGWAPEDVTAFLCDVAPAAKYEDVRSIPHAVRDTQAKIEAGEPVTGWPTLAKIIGADLVKCIGAWLGIERGAMAEDASRPELLVRAELALVTDEAEAALLADSEAGIYQRAGLLVRVSRDGARKVPGITRPPGAPTIVPLDPACLRERLDRSARWTKLTGKGDETKTVRALPPSWVSETLLARGEWPFAYLESIAEAPFLRPDGTVCEAAGYDAATGVLLEPAATFPAVPGQPTVADAGAALLSVCETLVDVPFVSEADHSAAIAAILALAARPAILGPVPLFAIRAPAPGTGKSLLADVIAVIGTGREAARMVVPETEDEVRKRVLALCIEGAPLVLVDNVSGSFGSDTLSSLLTAGQFKERALGLNKNVIAPHRATWLLTGNNVSFKGDLGRRVVPVDLDAKAEHPEDRTGFAFPDLLAHVRRERPRLLVAALTVLRAYCVAGRPEHGLPRKGSFEAWDDLVRGALLWARLADPLGGVERIREEGDADLDALRTGLAAWAEYLPPEPITAAEAIARAATCPELRAGLAALCGHDESKLDTRRLGYALRRWKGRIADGRRFEAARTEDRMRGVRWAVREERCG